MAQVRGMDPVHSLLSPPMSDQDQDPDAAAFSRLMQGGQHNTTMRSAPSATNTASSGVLTASYNYNTYQEVPQVSNNTQVTNNVEDHTMETEPTNQAGNAAANASYLPQTQTLYSAGAPNSTSKGTPGSGTNRPGLRLSFSNTPNAVTSVVNVFAQATPQSSTESPFSATSKKQDHGIASALRSSMSSQLGISISAFPGSNPLSKPMPLSDHGISKGLRVVSGIGAAALAAGGVSTADSSTAGATPAAPAHHRSFTEPRQIMSTNQADDEDDVIGEGYPRPIGGHAPISPALSPYLQPHSRPLSPNPDAHASPNMPPPPSPYQSPGGSPARSPQALSPLDGGLSPAAYSGGEGSGAEGDGPLPSPTGQTRGRLRGRTSKPQSPTSAPLGSFGRNQQILYVKGAPPGTGPVSRRSDAVENRHLRNRGQSVGESQNGSANRGTSPYAKGLGRTHSVANIGAHGASGTYAAPQPTQMRPVASPNYHGHPPLEVHSGSVTRESSLVRQDPTSYNNAAYPPGIYPQAQQPVQLDPSYGEHLLGAPISPHSPRYTGYAPDVGSPTAGFAGTPLSHHSPHSLSPHSLSPHSGHLPPQTPSPENGIPNVGSGYGGSNNSSPGLGLDPAGMVTSADMPFSMDPMQTGMLGNNMGTFDANVLYAQPAYVGNNAPHNAATNMWDNLGSGSSHFADSAGLDTSWMQQQQQQQSNNVDMGIYSWSPLTAEHVQAHGAIGVISSGTATYSGNPALSEQEALLEELNNSPQFWGRPNVDNSGVPSQSPPAHGMGTPAGSGLDHWNTGAMDPSYNQLTSSPPIGGVLAGAVASEPSMDSQALQNQNQQQIFTVSQHSEAYLLNTQTVPPSPVKGTVQPWDQQLAGQLPSGNLDEWSKQKMHMQGQTHAHQPSIQQVMYTQAVPSNQDQGLAPPPRRTPQRRRSKSDPYNLGHGPSPDQIPSFPGYPPGHMHAGPSMQPVSSDNYNASYSNIQSDGIVLGDGGGAHLKSTRSLPAPHPPRPHHRRAPTVVPTVAISDWDMPHFGQPANSTNGFPPSYTGQGHGIQDAILPQRNYNFQPGPTMYMQPTHQHMYRPVDIPEVKPFAQQGLGAQLPGAGPSSLGRASSMKQKIQGQRHEVDPKKLKDAFKPGSHRHDPALRYLLDLILTTRFYKDDKHEPIFGNPEAEQLLMHVRNVYPYDSRFARKSEGGYESRTVDDTEAREAQSIFMLFTENNQCLICGAQKDRAGRALGHVRSDIGHRPFHCTCEKCLQSPNPRKFFSDNLLDDHIKGQIHKQQCHICLSFFRRGGMKRHLSSKHPGQNHGSQDVHDDDDQEDQ